MYTSTFIIILTLLGIVSQQQVTVPNQEIVLQFTNDEVKYEEALNTIATVTKQLQDLGVDNILVKDLGNGELIITYYSDTDVAKIKSILSQEKNLQLGYASNNQDEKQSELPSDEKSVSYNFDVYEIQNGNTSDWNIDGYVLKTNSENDRFFNPNEYTSVIEIDVRKKENIVKVTYRLHNNIAIAIDTISRNIPEVRAGPNC